MDTYDIPLTIICDLGKNTATPQVISINQNEANIKKLRVEFVSGGKPWEIPTGFSCNIFMKKADGFAVYNPAESISGNAAVFNITPQMTAAVGENYFQIQVVKSEDDARGFAAVLSVQRAVLADDEIISEDEKETINGLIDRAENAVQEAEGAVDDAQSAVNNAQTAVKDADEAVGKANQATQDVEDALEQIIAASGNLIDDSKATSATTYSSNKIESDFLKKEINVATENTSLDTYLQPGIYFFSSQFAPLDSPSGTSGWLIVLGKFGVKKQIWMRYDAPGGVQYLTFVRVRSSSENWSGWEQYAMADQIEGLLPFTGGTMTGPLNLYRTLRIADDAGVAKVVIQAFNPGESSTAGDEILIGAGGNIFVGGGESAENLRNALQAGDQPEPYAAASERAYISSDTDIVFSAGCNTIADRKSMRLTDLGYLVPIQASGIKIGSPDLPFLNVYANNVYETNSPMYGKKVGFFGDSLTWGQTTNTSTKSANPYPKVFCDHYKCTMYNFGVQGATGSQSGSKTFDDQITANQETIKTLDYAFVMFGTNDFSQGIEPGETSKTHSTFDSPSDSFAYGIAKGLDRLYNLNNDLIVILLIPPYVQGMYDKAYWANGLGLQRENYDNVIKNLGKIFNIKVLDLTRNGMGVNEGTYYADTTHFNDAGYLLLGHVLIQEFMSGFQKHEYDYYENALSASCTALPVNLFDNTAIYTENTFYSGAYYKFPANTPVTSRNVYLIAFKGRFHFKCYCSASGGVTITVTIKDSSNHSFVIKRKLAGDYNDVSMPFSMNGSTRPTGNCTITIECTQQCYLTDFTLNFEGIQSSLPRKSVTEALEITVSKSGANASSYIFHMKDLTLEYDINLTGITSLERDEMILTAPLPSNLAKDLYKGHPSCFWAVSYNGNQVPLYWQIAESQIVLKALAPYSGSGTIYVAGAMPFMVDNRIYTVCCD